MQASGGVFKILSTDGGGIRGMIPAVLLAELEGPARRRTAQLYDLVRGTSTGGIRALGLTVPKGTAAPLFTVGQLLEMDEREGPPFSRSAWCGLIACGHRKKGPHEGIESVLWEYFGDARLSGAAADVLVPSYEIEHSVLFFLQKFQCPRLPGLRFSSVRRSRYFPRPHLLPAYESPHRYQPRSLRLIDRGTFANNPPACGTGGSP
jgi:patatin-like phospholipase/acyl hydrolase